MSLVLAPWQTDYYHVWLRDLGGQFQMQELLRLPLILFLHKFDQTMVTPFTVMAASVSFSDEGGLGWY